MNPYLRKICRERAIPQHPSSWQGNGGSGDKCPICLSSLFLQPRPIGGHSIYKCYSCDKTFERESWRDFREITIKETEVS